MNLGILHLFLPIALPTEEVLSTVCKRLLKDIFLKF